MGDNIVSNSILAQAEKQNNDQPSPASLLAKARAAKLSPERRSQIARKAAKARWAKYKRKRG